MALDLTPEQKATGKLNFEQAAAELARNGKMHSLAVGGDKGPDRRDFIKAGLAAGAVAPVSAAVYFGYEQWKGNKAVRTAFIGCGDEGGVLIGDHNPDFNEVVAVCDIRPSNLDRIFEGEPQGPRKGLNKIYGSDAPTRIKRYDSLNALLADKDKLGLEAVVIATPLNTHDVITKACMDAGLHVLCEKLMARTITKCKDMIKYAHDKGLLLGVGHQRHYSTLYAHALELVESGLLGDVKHIRALWHRNNSWPYIGSKSEEAKYALEYGLPYYQDGWCKPVLKQDAAALPPEKLKELAFGNVKEYGFEDVKELVRWRLYEKTGGGLMAELGSHQLDASSIILGHVHPLSVQGVGGKFFYGPGRNDRESDDGVWVTYEFPGKNHPKAGRGGKDDSDVVVVTYSSFNTNSFEEYGECVMGSRGTMIIEKEANVFLFKEPDKTKKGDAAAGGRDTKVNVTVGEKGKADMAASSTWGAGGAAISKGPAGPAWDSAVRGYRTEMEHFAYCVRRWDQKKGWAKGKDGKYEQEVPRCTGEVAMADAILALTANMAMKTRKRIEFEDAWFDADKPDNPESKYGAKGTNVA
jgi:predicted dehydrogenase